MLETKTNERVNLTDDELEKASGGKSPIIGKVIAELATATAEATAPIAGEGEKINKGQ